MSGFVFGGDGAEFNQGEVVIKACLTRQAVKPLRKGSIRA